MDNDCLPQEDKMEKIRSLQEVANALLQQFGVFAQKLSVDEQIVPQFWRHAVKRFSQRQKKGIDVPHPHYFMRCNQGMGGVDLLNCFISQYKPTIHPKKWCYPLLLKYINMICVAAWQLYVIFQRNP